MLLVVLLQVELVVVVVHVLIVFWLPINGSEFAGCGTIVSDAASTASGSGGARTGGISGAYIY